MNPFIYMVAVLVFGIAYMIFMSQKRKKFESSLDLDKEKAKYEDYKRALLDNEFSFLKQWMHPLPVDAFSSASLPQNTSNLYAETIFKGAQDFLRKSAGTSRIRYPKEYFSVLSGDDLHFFELDENNELSQHLVYGADRLSKSMVTERNKLKESIGIHNKQSKKYQPKVTELTFQLEEGPQKIEIHDRLNYKVEPLELLQMGKQNEKLLQYKIVGNALMDKLMEKYPNLKSPHTLSSDE